MITFTSNHTMSIDISRVVSTLFYLWTKARFVQAYDPFLIFMVIHKSIRFQSSFCFSVSHTSCAVSIVLILVGLYGMQIS